MIIGICGLIGSGKGTVADMLIDEHNFQKISFADALKDAVSTMFNWDRALLEGDTVESREWRETTDEFWTKETGNIITPRLVLQLFGTDCMRNGFYDGVWVSLVKQKILNNPDVDFVVPDTRFPNEKQMITDLGGQIWQVRRGQMPEWWEFAIIDNTTSDSNFMSEYKIHPSEWKWADRNDTFDAVIENNSTLDDLKDQVLNHLASK